MIGAVVGLVGVVLIAVGRGTAVADALGVGEGRTVGVSTGVGLATGDCEFVGVATPEAEGWGNSIIGTAVVVGTGFDTKVKVSSTTGSGPIRDRYPAVQSVMKILCAASSEICFAQIIK